MSEKKLAIFVEGQTEALFLQEFIIAFANEKQVTLRVLKRHGSIKDIVQLYSVPSLTKTAVATHSILIVDCGNDEQVKTAILEALPFLEKSGYSQVLGLRDFYPRPIERLAATRADLHKYVPTKGIPVHITLAFQEVEAWFAQEHTHYSRIDAKLNVDAIKDALSFDPRVDSAEGLSHPAAFLNDAYRLVQKGYSKKRKHSLRTIKALDPVELYVTVPDLIPHIKPFFDRLDLFFSVDP